MVMSRSSLQTRGYHPALLDVDGNMIVYDSSMEEPFCYPVSAHLYVHVCINEENGW